MIKNKGFVELFTLRLGALYQYIFNCDFSAPTFSEASAASHVRMPTAESVGKVYGGVDRVVAFCLDFSRLVSWVILMDQYPPSFMHANRREFV
jgi:hypothetical protein